MSINVTDRDLRDPHFVATVRDALTVAGIAPERLLLEISERAVLSDLEVLLPVARELRALGLGLVVDDYGTGYSSLDRMRRLPLSGLKLDGSFVAAMLDDAHADAIVQSTIRLARDVRMTVVAEGVERDALADRLREVGCRAGQGYALARPMRAPLLRDWLSARATDARPSSPMGGRVRP
jgi:EAL domain-containing protein (putative c-di-GMP-specific phosphodiesterase class I)